MSSLWLWVALVFYSLGLLHALVTVVRQRPAGFRLVMAAISIGFTFHFVSLVERWVDMGQFPITHIAGATSLFAFLITGGFLWAYRLYHMQSLSLFVFPVVFVMTLAAAEAEQPLAITSPALAASWIPLHVSLTLAGYAALLLSFLAGLMYLLQERELKNKKPNAFYYRLPPLETTDQLGLRALTIGFPLVTAGLIVGTLGAAGTWGAAGNTDWLRDPKITASFFFWLLYLVLIVTRLSAGWRGRKAALLTTLTLAMALLTWGTNYMNTQHAFLGH